jgi:hypothetical protein
MFAFFGLGIQEVILLLTIAMLSLLPVLAVVVVLFWVRTSAPEEAPQARWPADRVGRDPHRRRRRGSVVRLATENEPLPPPRSASRCPPQQTS